MSDNKIYQHTDWQGLTYFDDNGSSSLGDCLYEDKANVVTGPDHKNNGSLTIKESIEASIWLIKVGAITLAILCFLFFLLHILVS